MDAEHSDAPTSEERVDEVVAEYLRAAEAGRAPTREEVLARHPDLAPQLAVFFADRDEAESWAGPLRALMPESLLSRRVCCPHCHHILEVVAVVSAEISCPSCGSNIRVERGEPFPPAGRYLGRFELLGRAGVGAFATVYKARDPELGRIVAIKVPRAGHLANKEDLERFLREGRSLAQLHHPGIVPVHEVGQADGVPYLVAEFVEGRTLAGLLQAQRPSPREAAGLLAQVADALHYVHEHGVIHRDLKPSNILLESVVRSPWSVAKAGETRDPDYGQRTTDYGQAKITDFGLARREGLETTMTLEGQVLGTPAYMSPELAAGEAHRVDGRSDVYSLGVILYQLLTGELPFRGTARMVLHHVLHEEPRSPRSLNDRLPRDLETICLKCLAKAPARRYASARDLGDDLRRFLNGEPIRARPVTVWERGWQWAKRKPAIAALLALVVFVTALGFGLVTWQWQRAEMAREGLAQKAGELEAQNYYGNIALAYQEVSADNLGRAEQLLDGCPPRLRQWEWYYLQRLCRVEPVTIRDQKDGVYSVAFSPDGQRFASARGNGTIGLHDVNTGEEIQTLQGHTDYVFSVTFHPDGNHLASASKDRTVRVWDLRTGKEVFQCDGHRGDYMGASYGVAFSPDGERLAAGSEKGLVRIWNASNGQKLLDLPGHEQMAMCVAFSPDGRLLASGTREGYLRVWDPGTGALLRPPIRAHEKRIGAVAFSPDGWYLATASLDRTVTIWDVPTGKCLRTLGGHTGFVAGLAFSRDSRRLSTGADKMVKIWDPESGQEILNLRGHTSWCRCLTFSPDGWRLASACVDGTIRIWDATPLTGGEGQEALTLHEGGEVWSVAYSPDGRRIAYGGWEKTIGLWDATHGTRIPTVEEVGDVFQVSFSTSDGKYLASSAVTGDRKTIIVNIRDATTGQVVRTLPFQGIGTGAFCVTFSPDGRYLLRSGSDFAIQVVDAQSGEPVGILGRHRDDIWCLRFSPDGKLLASASSDFTVKLWDATRLRQEQEPLLKIDLPSVTGLADRVAFSPDSRHLVTGGEGYTVKIWDARTGEAIQTLRGHTGDIQAVAVSPDGRWIASAGDDTTVRLWDAKTWKPVHKLRGHTSIVSSLSFSPDRRHLVSGSWDKTVRVWDLTRLGIRASLGPNAPGGSREE